MRRERISERMRVLQALVPGCDKVNFVTNQINCSLHLNAWHYFLEGNMLFFLMQVTGKALILDEIINYVQSLQNQVEVIHMANK